MTISAQSQDQSLPYYQIPEAPDDYSAGNVLGRLLDGLGFRYYWATEGLRDEDLQFRPTEESRSIDETLDHLYGLSLSIVNSVQSIPNVRRGQNEMSFEEKRKATLLNIQKASNLVKGDGPSDIDGYQVIFERDGGRSEFPFWNMINGPIADALWHTGQVVSLRRTSGNPFNSKVSVFNGRLRE